MGCPLQIDWLLIVLNCLESLVSCCVDLDSPTDSIIQIVHQNRHSQQDIFHLFFFFTLLAISVTHFSVQGRRGKKRFSLVSKRKEERERKASWKKKSDRCEIVACRHESQPGHPYYIITIASITAFISASVNVYATKWSKWCIFFCFIASKVWTCSAKQIFFSFFSLLFSSTFVVEHRQQRKLRQSNIKSQ